MAATRFGVLNADIPTGGGTKTDPVEVGPNCIPVAVQTPASMVGTTITFEVLIQGESTYRPVYNEGTLYSITTAAGRYHALNPNVMLGVQKLKIVSGSSETQGTRFLVVQRPVR